MELYGYQFIRESEVLHGDPKFGIPELKKYPMPDAKHVQSAIKFFNYVSPKYEKQLARAILARMKEYGMSFDDFGVGEENRFSKYIPKDELMHYGLKGMKWGTRRWQNYDATNTFNAAGIQRYFGRTPGKDSQAVKEPKVYHKPSGASKKIGSSDSVHTQVRRDREKEIASYEKDLPKTSGLTPEQKKKYAKIAIGTAAAVGVGVGIYFAYKCGAINKIAEFSKNGVISKQAAGDIMHATLKDGDEVLRQGSVLHRMSAYANVDYSKATKPLYTSFDKVDVATYMTRLKDWHGTGKRYDVTLKALEDINIPSKQHAQEIFQELWDKDPSYQKALFETITQAYKKIFDQNTYYKKLGIDTLKLAKAQAAQDIKADPFKSAMYSIVKGQSDSQKLLGQYSTRGYQAIIDYFDQGVMAEKPLIVLDPSKTLQKQGEQLVTKKYAYETLKNLYSQGVRELRTGSTIKEVMNEVVAGKIPFIK